MIAILLAAQLSAEIVRGMPAEFVQPAEASAVSGQVWRSRRVFVSPPVVCRNRPIETSGPAPALLLRPQDRKAVRLRKLGDLPKANLEIAVERSVGGCPNPIVVRYQVEGDGRAADGARN